MCPVTPRADITEERGNGEKFDQTISRCSGSVLIELARPELPKFKLLGLGGRFRRGGGGEEFDGFVELGVAVGEVVGGGEGDEVVGAFADVLLVGAVEAIDAGLGHARAGAVAEAEGAGPDDVAGGGGVAWTSLTERGRKPSVSP